MLQRNLAPIDAENAGTDDLSHVACGDRTVKLARIAGLTNGDELLATKLLAGCFGQVIAPGCEMMDYDGNSIIDAIDAQAFFEDFDGPLADCDGNGEPDLLELLVAPGVDEVISRSKGSAKMPRSTLKVVSPTKSTKLDSSFGAPGVGLSK